MRGLIEHWAMPSITYSTGSSAVTMLVCGSLMWLMQL